MATQHYAPARAGRAEGRPPPMGLTLAILPARIGGAMPVPSNLNFYIDPSRCIGCQACVQACTECETHKGHSMIHLEFVDRPHTTQTIPVICMHCDSPTCAEV